MRCKRFDYASYESPEITPQGYLRADAFATRTGVFLYRMGDGAIRRELRMPDEVFNPDSMRTLGQIPVTLEHPMVPLDASNTRQYQKGFTSEKVDRIDTFLKTRITITDQDAIDLVKNGSMVELSCGYLCDLIMESGIWNGEAYDAVQKNIVYNHLAVVQQGRAGPEARLKLDSADGMQEKNDAPEKKSTQEKKDLLPLESTVNHDKENPKEGAFPMAKITIRGVEYEIDQGVAGVVSSELARLDESEKALTAQKSENEKLNGRCDGLEADLKRKGEEIEKARSDSKLSRDQIVAAGKARVEIESVGSKILGSEVKVDAMSDVEIQKAVIEKVIGEKMDGKSDGYIEGLFYSVKKMVAEEKNDAFKKALTGALSTDSLSDDEKVAKARLDARERALSAHKNPK